MAMQKIFAREILDSRGNPTVEVDLHTAKGNTGPLNGFTWEDPNSICLCPPTLCHIHSFLWDRSCMPCRTAPQKR